MGVIIDNQLFSNPPNIESKIAGGQAYIRGSFNKLEAETVASIINEGALPVKFSIIEERTVGPSLGVESIEAGMKAVMVAFILVVLVIIVRYKLSGFIATFGLFANFLILGALLSWLGFTLTLPGIAGLILTLGMAVDANVIIFERMKEEVVAGKSPRSAITNGFDKAFSTIFDSNLTTLLAALVLSQLGTGPIKGFAVTLTVGIISSMFTALYITRFIYDLISEKKILNKLSV
jgi:preprotein translocase subunit SecD